MITSVPSDISQLKDLKNLGLQDNKLTSLPNQLGELKKLEVLSIDKNPIVTLSNIDNLGSLYLLTVYKTKISSNEVTQLRSSYPQIYITSDHDSPFLR